MFQGFTWHAGLPRFCGGFLELIFDSKTGFLVDTPDVDAIHAVRQLCLLYSKLELSTSEKRRRASIRGFVDCESEIKRADSVRDMEELHDFRRMSNLVWREVLQGVDNDLWRETSGQRDVTTSQPFLVPKHGPGATADKLTGNGKYDLREWSQRLEDVFPYGEYCLPSWRYHDRYDCVDLREPGTERPVRVISVPKTLKAQRIIAIEPSYMQYMQQGLAAMIVPAIQNNFVLGRIVGFNDQWRNNHLALKGSLDGSLATLDLSEASDRVSNQLVRAMLDRFPNLQEAVDATRSRKADVPGHGILRLAKYASMGSALTFPVEAMVFTAIVFLGIERAQGSRLTRSDITKLRDVVRVYGDDIIVPVEFAPSVIDCLQQFGLKVNVHKSFLTGRFRESCGKEYYSGQDVSVVKVRHVVVLDGKVVGLPSSRRFAQEIESTVALRNRFYLLGLWRTAAWLDDWIGRLLGQHYPTVEVHESAPWEEPAPRSQVLGRWSVLPVRYSLQRVGDVRWNADLHTLSMRGYVVRRQIPSSTVSGVGALQKVLSPRRIKPFEDAKHLERAGRAENARIKLGWIPVT